MAKRLVGKELIEETMLELLEEKSIEQISVAEIARCSGISTRAFYNHFSDKHAVVAAIYLRYMGNYLDCSLKDWYGHMEEFFFSHSKFMENTLCYNGQNNLADVIIELEWEKLKKHIKPEVLNDPIEYKRTEIAIEYMLYGNIGSTRNSFVHKNHSALDENMYEAFGGTWGYLSSNISPIIIKNLSSEVIEPFCSKQN